MLWAYVWAVVRCSSQYHHDIYEKMWLSFCVLHLCLYCRAWNSTERVLFQSLQSKLLKWLTKDICRSQQMVGRNMLSINRLFRNWLGFAWFNHRIIVIEMILKCTHWSFLRLDLNLLDRLIFWRHTFPHALINLSKVEIYSVNSCVESRAVHCC